MPENSNNNIEIILGLLSSIEKDARVKPENPKIITEKLCFVRHLINHADEELQGRMIKEIINEKFVPLLVSFLSKEAQYSTEIIDEVTFILIIIFSVDPAVVQKIYDPQILIYLEYHLSSSSINLIDNVILLDYLDIDESYDWEFNSER